MTSITRQYTTAASQARSAVDKTADVTVQGARTLTAWLPGLPQIDLIPAVERYFDLVQRTVDINRHLAVRWAQAASSLSGVAREQAEKAGNVVREQADSAGDIMREKAQAAERTAREQAEQAEQAEKKRVREARNAERDQARQAQDKARERYQNLTKAELSDLLAERQLPKSGNVDELIERLVEADSTPRTLPGTVRKQAEAADRTAREQAEKAEQERARKARQAEREKATQAPDKARERYRGLAKAELSDLLAERQLPKSGNVYELVERLVEADK